MQKTCLFGFYNLDNFFPHTGLESDHEFSEFGKKKWTLERYNLKVHKISNIIDSIDRHFHSSPLGLMTFSEIGSDEALLDLLNHEKLKEKGWNHLFLHSNDPRAIHFGLIYDPNYIEISSTKAFPVELEDQGETIQSRNIWRLEINCMGQKMSVHLLHFPSQKRRLNKSLRTQAVNQLLNSFQESSAIILGDFNEQPYSDYFKPIVEKGFEQLIKCTTDKPGSIKHHRKWLLFDQIWFKKSFQDLKILHAEIYNPSFLMDPSGRNKYAPFRTYIGKHFLGGPSDHFPVLCQIKKSAE